MAPSRAEQAERARRQILQAAVDLFAERGYSGTSLAAIADAVGLTKAHVYHYFPTKTALLAAAIAPLQTDLQDMLESASGVEERDERVRGLVAAYVDILLKHRELNALTANDPVMRREKHLDTAMRDLDERAIAALFGERPTLEERLAYLQLRKLGALVNELGPVSDEELRAALTASCRRILSMD